MFLSPEYGKPIWRYEEVMVLQQVKEKRDNNSLTPFWRLANSFHRLLQSPQWTDLISIFTSKQPLTPKRLTENHTGVKSSDIEENQPAITDLNVTVTEINIPFKSLDLSKACRSSNIPSRFERAGVHITLTLCNTWTGESCMKSILNVHSSVLVEYEMTRRV